MMRHRLFVPKDLVSGVPVPLIVALHGCQQTAVDFATGTRFDEVASRRAAIVLYPEQSKAANGSACWNWFLPQHQERRTGEPAAILQLVEETWRRYPIDRGRVYVAGLSAGGAMAAILGEQAPDVFSGVGIMAGVALHAGHDLPSALSAMAGKRVLPKGQPPQAASRMLGIEGMTARNLHPLVAELSAGLRPVLGDAGNALPNMQSLRLDGASNGAASKRATAPPSAFANLRVMVWTGSNDTTVAPENATSLANQYAELLGLEAGRSERHSGVSAHVSRWRDAAGRSRLELWTVDRMGHAWSGGSPDGSFTYPPGPDASTAMLDFFLSP